MKTKLRKILAFSFALILVLLAGCREADKDYGVDKDNNEESSASQKYKDVVIPEISSDDTVMPPYLDISLYDVENYADIYLGSKFKYSAIYCGQALTLPSNHQKMTDNGWKMVENENISADAMMLANEKREVEFVNEQGKYILATFYNPENSSSTLKSCNIVKFNIPENVGEVPQSRYGEFQINGISNHSSINDVFEALGYPSHFYGVSDEVYYFDYFFTAKDKRSRITVYMNVIDDYVISISFSKY